MFCDEERPDAGSVNLVLLQFVVAVGFLLVAVLAFTYPQNAPQLGLVNPGPYNWSSPLSHVRLLSLPIAKKYNLQGLKDTRTLLLKTKV